MKKGLLFFAAAIAAVIVLLCVAGVTYKRNFPKELGGETVSIGKYSIRYKMEGRGPVVLLLHGAPGTLDMWDVLVPYLTNTLTVVRIDRIGSGGSSIPNERPTIALNAKTLNEFIETMKSFQYRPLRSFIRRRSRP